VCVRCFGGVSCSADLFDSFGWPTNLGGVLSKLKDVTETLPKAKTRRGSLTMPAPRGWWVAKQNKDTLTLQVPMPGLAKEDVKVRAEKNTVVIMGCKETAEDGKGSVDAKETAKDGKETAKDGKGPAADGCNDDLYEGSRITRRIDLPADAYKMDQVKAEMKNGLLKVTVPRVQEEERKDVFYVTVE
jgi:HSP20 family protein